MEMDGKDVPLSPGMAVTVEIKTGAQRVITYLMSPLLRFKQEALHERRAEGAALTHPASLRAQAKQSRAAFAPIHRDCFVASGFSQ
jgi:hypothetical protein